MATLVQQRVSSSVPDERFFLRAAILMSFVIVAGFSLQWIAGRSTFHAPVRVHLHALVFMAWVGIYLLQNLLVARDKIALHRRLGWIAAAWMVPMVFFGCYATVAMVRAGQVPFVFKPLHFLVFDPVTVFAFVGLTGAAIILRKRTDWHRRLHFCGMSMLLMPGIGRILPMPLLIPFAWEAAFAGSLLFPVAGVVRDIRRSGAAHPAWLWGIGAMLLSFVLIEAITYGGGGIEIYRAVTAASPGAKVAPLEFGAPPAAR